jgi:MoxR-like ATPase
MTEKKAGAEENDPSKLWVHFNPRIKAHKTDEYHFDVAPDPAATGANDLVTTINVALALGRPILVTGEAGTGKSSIARGVADALGLTKYFRATVTSRTEASELKADFDDIQRLSDANAGADRQDALATQNCMRPGVLWQVLNPKEAEDFWGSKRKANSRELEEIKELNAQEKKRKARYRVLLIDEIDKGDIDFTNDLLDVFDDGVFEVPRIGHTVERDDAKVLIVLTANKISAFSDAFTRRCFTYRAERIDKDTARKIARCHWAYFCNENAAAPDGIAPEEAASEIVETLSQAQPDPDRFLASDVADFVSAYLNFVVTKGSRHAQILRDLQAFYSNLRASR